MNEQKGKTECWDSGFIALISVIIISAILLLVATTLSFGGFFGRFSVLEHEFKKKSLSLAEACAEEAKIKLFKDNGYSGNEIVKIGLESCEILSSSNPTGNPRDFDIKAIYKNSHTNIKISIDSLSGEITSWIEVPNF